MLIFEGGLTFADSLNTNDIAMTSQNFREFIQSISSARGIKEVVIPHARMLYEVRIYALVYAFFERDR